MTPRVINIKSREHYDVYIGNLVRHHPQKYPQTKWGNPFKVKKYGREQAIQMYKKYIVSKPELLNLIPIELKDKTLGCWCKPELCHGDILAQIADSG